jgi:hypothetical protein
LFNVALLIIDEVGFEPMNRREASLFFRLRFVPCSPVPPNKPMQRTGLRPAADRQAVRRLRRWALADGVTSVDRSIE